MARGTRARRARQTLLYGTAAVSLLVVSGLLPMHMGFLRGMIEDRVLDATGIQLSLDGPIVARLGPRAGVRTGDITVAAPGGEPLLELGEARVRVGLFALMRGRIHLRDATVTGVHVDYCSPLPEIASGDGVSETPAPKEPPPEIAVDAIRVDDVTVRCGANPPDVSADSIVAAAPSGEPIEIDLDATVLGVAIAMNATGGKLEQLLAGSDFPIDASLDSEHGKLGLSGTLRQPDDGVDAELTFQADVADPPAFAKALGISLPATGPFTAEGTVRTDLANLEAESIAGALGETRFAGSGSVALGGARKRADVSMSIQQLDLAPFLPAGEKETAAVAQQAADEPSLDPLFDAINAMKAFDAGLELSVERVLGVQIDVSQVTVDANFTNGVVDVTTARAELLGASVEASGKLDAGADCPSLELAASIVELELAELRRTGWLNAPVEGRVSGVQTRASTCGRSLSSLVDALSGTASVAEGQLEIGEELPLDIERLDLHVAPGEETRIDAAGAIAGGPVNVSLAVGSLQAVLGAGDWPVRLDVEGAGSNLRVAGTASLATGQPAFDVAVDFHAPRAGALSTWIDVDQDAELPLGATTRLRLDESRFVAEDIAVTVGDSNLDGEAVWRHSATPDTFAVKLRSNSLDLDHLDELLPPASGGSKSEQAVSNQPGDPVWRRLPPIDLDIALDTIHGGRLDIQDLAISGHLEGGLIKDARVGVVVEQELELRGELDVDVRDYPASLVFDAKADNADLGRILRELELVDDLRVRADGLTLRVVSTGEDPREIVSNSRIDADVLGFAWDIPRAGQRAPEAPQSVTRIRLDKLDISTAPERPIEMSSSGTIDEFSVDLWIKTPSLPDILSDVPELPLRLVFGANEDVAMIDLVLDRSAEDMLRVRFELSGQVVDAKDRDLASLDSPLADYMLKSDVIFGDSELSLPNLVAEIGSSSASGRFSLTGDGRRRIEVELTSPRLQADDLQYFTRFADSKPVAEDASASVPDDADGPDDGSAEARGPVLLVSDLIDEFQESYDLDLRVTGEDLRVGSDRLGSIDLHLNVDEEEFNLAPLTIEVPGGGIDVEYRWTRRDGRVNAELIAQSGWLVYGGLLRLADPESESRGVAYLDVNLTADTPWSPDVSELELLLRDSSGSIKAAVWPENIEAGILDLWTANLVFALLPVAADGDPSRLNCVVAHFVAEDGLLKAKTAMLDSTDTIVRGRGKIDLAQGQLDLLVTPQAKRERFLSASTPVKVTGPLREPEIGVEATGIFGTVIRWYYSLIYVPFKWLTGERFPEDGTATCFDQMGWELTPELEAYFRERDFSVPPPHGVE